MLSDAVNSEMGNCTSEVNIRVGVIVVAVRPMAVELKDTKHDAEQINFDLGGVSPRDKAQKLQAIEADFRVNHPPEVSNCTTVDSVNHTVIVPLAEYTPRVLSEPVLGEPTM